MTFHSSTSPCILAFTGTEGIRDALLAILIFASTAAYIIWLIKRKL